MDLDLKLQQIIATEFGLDPAVVLLESNLEKDLGASSLDRLELLLAIEEAFELEIPDEDRQKLLTVQDVQVYLARRQHHENWKQHDIAETEDGL